MAGVHKSREIYDDPMSFQLKRFVEMHSKSQGGKYEAYKVFTKSGARVRNPVIWWGGGQHIVVTHFDMADVDSVREGDLR